jgi:Protein of unknown function (DUF3604)
MAQICSNYEKLRQPFFGDLHFHSVRSADPSTLDTRNTPNDAFRFATGAAVGLAPFVDTRTENGVSGSSASSVSVSPHPYCFPGQQCQYTATRTLQLNAGRTLDFAATTDHSEYLGEDNICFWEGTEQCRSDRDCRQTGQICLKSPNATTGKCVPEGYASPQCILARTEINQSSNGTRDRHLRDLYYQSRPPSLQILQTADRRGAHLPAAGEKCLALDPAGCQCR